MKTALPDLTSPTTQTPSRTLAAPSPGDGPSPDRRSRSAVFSRLSTFWINLKEKPPLPETSILDEFLLFTEGEDHIIVSDGFQHRQGSSLWRGEAGRIIDSEHRDPDHVAEHPETVYLDDSKASHTASESIERTTSTMKLHRRVRLPSEVNDAHSSSSTLSPALAKVTHRVEIDVIYSILGQDQRGKPITSDNNNGRSAQEGSVRLVRGLFEIDLASCSITRSIIQPPSYPSPAIATPHMTSLHRRLSTASTVTRMIPTRFSPVMPHTRAFRASNHRTVGSKVIFYEEAHVREALERHRSERPDCACRLWDGSRESERLDRWISGSA